MDSYIAELPAILDSFDFLIILPIPLALLLGGRVGSSSHEVEGKGYVNAENSQIVSLGAILTSTYHTKQLNLWPNSSASCVVNYNQQSACQGEMEPFEDHPSTHGHLTSLRNKPHQK